MDNQSNNKWLILIEEKEAVVGMLTESGNLLVSEQKGWDGEDPNSLVASLDSGIGSCLAKEEGLARPKKTIFILPPFWVSHRGEVLPSRKKTLKFVCEHLDLLPEGFLVGEEVLANFYSQFVSIYFGQEYLRFSAIKEKSVEVQEEMENGEDLDPEDVAVFLRQLNGKTIIPKEMIFWGRIKEGNKERLLSHQWQEEKIFDTTPKIKIFMWPEFFKLVAQVVQGEVKLEVVKQEVKGEELDEFEKDKIEGSKEREEEIKEEKEEEEPEEAESSKSAFGFAAYDVAQKEGWQSAEEKKKVEQSAEPAVSVQPEPQVAAQKPPLKAKIPKPNLPKIKLPSLPRFNLRFFRRKGVLLIVALPMVLIAGLFLSWRISKATVEIYVTPEELTDNKDVRLDSEAKTVDSDQGIVPVEQVSIEKSSSKSKPTSGEKLIGEKATGEIKIFNRTADRAEFEAGTSLIGPGNLEFVLDNQVSIASKTADLETGVDRWGETMASVTAADIGAKYNLAADSMFTVNNYSEDDYLARNSEAFSGGTSREIRAVSEEDQQELMDSLTEELTASAKKDLEKKLSDSQVIDGSWSTNVTEKQFSAEPGEEKDNLSLDLTVEVTADKISQQELMEIAGVVLAGKIESGQELKEGSLQAKLNVDEKESEAITGQLTLKGKVYPKIDKQSLSQQIAGKKEKKAKELIRESYPRIYRNEVNYQLPFLKYFSYLPPRSENIIIEVKE